MDIGTHALTSYVIARGLFARRRWPVVVGMLFAGTLADVDLLSALFGPSAYFAARRTYTHSLLGTVVVILLAILFTRALERKNPVRLASLFWPMLLAAGAHVLLDSLQCEGVMLLWPFRSTRFGANWLPSVDLWVVVLLLGGILVPELFRLVSSEIGAKNKAPRGRNGAVVVLVLLTFYIAGRAVLHASSNGLLGARSYQGESARLVGSYPDSFSVLTWHGVVETTSLLCQVDVPVGPGRAFDPESADCLHKPEASPELDAVQKTDLARKYVSAVPFPRAVVEKTQDGYEIVIRSMRDIVEGETYHRLAARFQVNADFSVSSEELVWTNEVHLR
ncbi:MAG TPA: metal-dependent hydrolase [Candidatus Sulfotelmatobacter sp.]|nr:metal-dependent hydrolase [Candidatus Sulfotelmatobacter sp.]